MRSKQLYSKINCKQIKIRNFMFNMIIPCSMYIKITFNS